jgi:uncharacterized membrane protein YfcA
MSDAGMVCAVPLDMLLLGALLALPMGLLLGLLGGGGSILTVPILVYVLGLEPKEAIATSLLVVGVTSAISSLHHARAGNVIYRTGLIFGAFAMAGAYLGGVCAGFLSGHVLILLFALLMLVAGIAMLRPRSASSQSARSFAPVKAALVGAGVGGITGLVGAGGGFVIVPAMVIFGGLGVRAAIGTSLLIIAMNSFAGLAGHLGHLSIDLWLATAITLPAVLGSFAGARLSGRISAATLRRVFGYFVLAMAAFMLYKEVPSVFL